MKLKIGDRVKKKNGGLFYCTQEECGTVVGFSDNGRGPWVEIKGEYYMVEGVRHVNYHNTMYLVKIEKINFCEKNIKKIKI
jgi:hypothetical protein